MLGDGSVRQGDGSVRRVATCTHPTFDRSGNATPAGEPPPPITHGYPAYSLRETGQDAPIDGTQGGAQTLSVQFQVPAPPRVQAGQTIYLFPGLEPAATGDWILQPVLGWTAGTWTLSSWSCCLSGSLYHSTPFALSSERAARPMASAVSGPCPRRM